jgi:hypothetical protein
MLVEQLEDSTVMPILEGNLPSPHNQSVGQYFYLYITTTYLIEMPQCKGHQQWFTYGFLSVSLCT